MKYIFNVNQFTVFVCVCFRGALFRVQTLRIRCWFWLVLKAAGRESWPTDCAGICVNSSAMGLFLNVYILELTYLTGNSPSGNNQPYLHIMFASAESVTPQGGLTTVSRMALITISSTGQSFRVWFTRCVSLLFSPFDLRSKWKKSCARSDYEQIDILASKLKYWKCLLARRHPPFRQS